MGACRWILDDKRAVLRNRLAAIEILSQRTWVTAGAFCAATSLARLFANRRFGTMFTIDGQFQLGRGILGTTVSVAQAKSQFAALVARAEAGEKIIVTRSGRAVACLGPLPGRQPIKYGELSGLFLSEDLTVPEEVIRDFEQSK